MTDNHNPARQTTETRTPMTKRITIKTANEWRALAGSVSVKEIAERYGVHTGTVYYHINRKHAAIRREQWRKCTARRKAERRAAA